MNRKRHKLSIEWVKIAALKLDPRNAKKHSNHQIKLLAQSIKALGFIVPVVIDQASLIRAGHARVTAAKTIGMSEVPVIRLTELTDEQFRAFSIAENRLSEIATWDQPLLAETLRDLSMAEIDFSLEVTGFSVAEIDLKIEGLSTTPTTIPDPADEIDVIETDPVSKLGDLWLLGRHRVRCDNALERNSYATLMGEQLAHVVFSDPPYNVKIDGHATGKGKVRHREFAMAAGEMNSNGFTDFLSTTFVHTKRNSVNGSLHYYFMDWRHQIEILNAGRDVFGELKNLCVWVKNNAGMGSLYRSRHELVFVFKNGNGKHRNNVELGRHGRSRSNVWEYAGSTSFGRNGEEGNLSAQHPTVKPVALIADALLDCSARGEIVLDPFIGVGSTLCAAERVGRACFGMDIDPLYVDATIRRWQKYSGDHAIHAVSGTRFDDLATKR